MFVINFQFLQCEIFSLELLIYKTDIKVFGLFNINRRGAFSVMVQVSLYIIFFAQKDYKNLFYKRF